ncbi:helix-turn-helix domain-containing protein [Hymenobacter rubripertinctus]|uniref:XRE family transcriptional regulator n=1 Tax=Hymenobacter rubripertinctus TaxID=2029981 RepID=A0A418R733_9BACT|nr:helix-turn-helix transcriptional regulator [Hymenobacter rubripertinctus]RIY13390.1 XRE family transcriptional regulator [Hymenobacter rubripertinctus]
MPRKSIPSTTLFAQVRTYFGLEQQELAAYLGISRPYVADIEAGRRSLTSPLLLRLSPLAVLLPAAGPARPAAPQPELAPPGAPAPGPLEARLDYCQHHAAKLRRELKKWAATQAAARRWLAVLPGLLAAPAPAEVLVPPAEAARARQWLLAHQAQAQATLHDAEEAARYHLLRLRLAALETEAAGLQALL